ncbi:MAG: AraC family transcriptional regulator [Enterobacteriaceae bacterium]
MNNVIIEQRPITVAFAVEHTGAYTQIASAFEQIWHWVFSNNLQQQTQYGMGIYYNDPTITPAEQCKSDACVVLSEPVPTPAAPVRRIEIPAGQYARYRHVGPYTGLEQAYTTFFSQWLPSSGYECDDCPPFEVYLNNPQDTAPEELITDIYVKIKSE